MEKKSETGQSEVSVFKLYMYRRWMLCWRFYVLPPGRLKADLSETARKPEKQLSVRTFNKFKTLFPN